MLRKRKGPTSSENTFTNKWSGIDHRIKMRAIPSKPSDATEIGDSNDLEANTAFRRKLLRGGNNINEVNIAYKNYAVIIYIGRRSQNFIDKVFVYFYLHSLYMYVYMFLLPLRRMLSNKRALVRATIG